MPAEYVKGLKCRECGRHYEKKPIHVCEFCFGPLEVDYDYDAIKKAVSREKIARACSKCAMAFSWLSARSPWMRPQ